MSLSISTTPTGPSSDGSAACASGTNSDPTGLPFDAILDSQAQASEAGEDEDSIGGVAPFDVALTAAADAVPTNQTAVDPLAGFLSGFGFGLRRLLAREIGKDPGTLSALEKDKSANEAALFLLAAHDVPQRLESPRRGVSPEEFLASQEHRAAVAIDAQLTPDIVAALVDAESVPAASGENATAAMLPTESVERATAAALPTEVSTSLADLLAKAAAQRALPDQADQVQLPDVTLRRPATLPQGPVFAEAVQLLASGQGRFADPDSGFNQPSASMGFDRRSTRGAAPAIHVADTVAAFDASLKTASPAAATAPLPNEDGVVASIVQSMRLQMRDGVGTAVVHLEPDYLGAVSIALRVEGGVVTATLHAENPQVRAWMENNAPLLRESLAQQGLTLDRLLVTDERVADDRSGQRRHQQEQEQHARQRPRRDDAATFEVIV